MEDIKKEIAALQSRQATLEKEILNANAKHEAHMDMLKKEFEICSIEEIDNLVSRYEANAKDLKKIIDESLQKIREHIKNLEVSIHGK